MMNKAAKPAAVTTPAPVNPHSPRTIQYEIHRLSNLPEPAAGMDNEAREELVQQRDGLAARLLATQEAMAGIDAQPLPDDIDAAVTETARRDALRVTHEKALALIAERLAPVQNALAVEHARADQIAADAEQLRKLTIAAAHLSGIADAVGQLEVAAGNLQRAAQLSVPRGDLAGIGGLPAVHFQLQDLVARIGGAMMLLGHVR